MFYKLVFKISWQFVLTLRGVNGSYEQSLAKAKCRATLGL